MPVLEYVDGIYRETVSGWEITTYEGRPGDVNILGPKSKTGGRHEDRQEASIDKEGELCLDVRYSERGRGHEGDCASDRYIPILVVEAAIRIWKVSVDWK